MFTFLRFPCILNIFKTASAMNSIKYSLDSEEIRYLCNKDKRLAKVISSIGPLEYYIHEDVFAFLVHEIVEQMLSAKAGNVIFSRLVDLCNGQLTPENISILTTDQIKTVGMSYKKACCISDLSSMILSHSLDLTTLESLSNERVISELTSIRGIGLWTAKMCLIFSLNRLDVLPYEDKAFLQSYKWLYNTTDISPNSVIKRCKKWSPYASIASRYMYIALDSGLTKSHFQSFE